jgi:hypothetical protein
MKGRRHTRQACFIAMGDTSELSGCIVDFKLITQLVYDNFSQALLELLALTKLLYVASYENVCFVGEPLYSVIPFVSVQTES